MVIFLSGPMTGYPNYNYEAFYEAEHHLKEKGYIVLNPAAMPLGLERKQYMPIDLAMIDQSDAICFLPNAKESVGSNLERAYAAYQEKIFFENIDEVP